MLQRHAAQRPGQHAGLGPDSVARVQGGRPPGRGQLRGRGQVRGAAQPTGSGRDRRDDPHQPSDAQQSDEHKAGAVPGTGSARRHELRQQDRAAQRRLSAGQLVQRTVRAQKPKREWPSGAECF